MVYLVWVRYRGMPGDTVAARYCTLCDVCVTGGRAGEWPTTSTYRGCFAPQPVTRSGSLLRSARASRPGERRALLSAVFERQDCLIPKRDKGPPRNDQASTPIKPAVRSRGRWPTGCGGRKVGRAPWRGTGGGMETAPQQVVSERGATRRIINK